MKFSLRQKLYAVFAALLAIALVIGVQSIRRFSQLGDSIDIILRENYRSVIACQQMKEELERIDSGLLFYMLGDRQAGRSMIDLHLQRFREALRAEKSNLTLPDEPRLAGTLESDFSAYSRLLPGFYTLPAASMQHVYKESLFPLFQRIKNTADEILRLNQANMIEANGRARLKAVKARRNMILFLAGCFAIAVVFVVFSNRWILKPVCGLIASVSEIRHGNLNLVVPVETRDEIGRLSEAFNDMVESLRVFRRSDQAKLLRIQSSTQEALRHLPEAIAVVDPDGVVEVANESARRYFGLLPGVPAADSTRPWAGELFRKVMAQRRSAGGEYKLGALQVFILNRERFFLPKAVPILDAEKELNGMIFILEDITLLRQNDEIKQNLLSTISHQLKTPLTAIRMAVHLLLEEKVGALNEKQAELLISAREESDRLNGIIGDLLDISRFEAGGVHLQLEPVSCAELVEAAVESYRNDAVDRGVILEVELPDDLPEVIADRNRIPHVFDNLLSNAIKYSPVGGHIRISARKDNRMVWFWVADDGAGIPAEYHPRVFEKFFRVPGQEKGRGEGLGLAIAREIVRSHHGEITFTSALGRGTTFRFSLPHVAAEKQGEESHA